MEFLASEIATACNGTVVGDDHRISGATIDSRSVSDGDLFVPLVAERDGHDFIANAVYAGARTFLTSQPDRPQAADTTAIVVDDTADALQALGRLARTRLRGPVVGVTGSVGKTSVKDMIVAACGVGRQTHANVGSFNNELGLPLTLINAPADADVVVTEMGARGMGHIAQLAEIARPTMGVVTRVAGAHTELFGSLDAIAEAKSELIQSLPTDGVAVLNADDHRVVSMRSATSADVWTFGLAADATVRIADITLDALVRPSFTVFTPAGERRIDLPIAGRHMAINAGAAVAVALALDIPLDLVATGLETASLSAHRMAVEVTAGGATVINDAYNANPTSMRAALDALVALPAERRFAVVGVMAELGTDGDASHAAIALEAADRQITVIAVAASAYGERAHHVESIDEALERLGPLGAGDAVLVKGSRVAELERVVDHLVRSES